jgi:hypothetical protein
LRGKGEELIHVPLREHANFTDHEVNRLFWFHPVVDRSAPSRVHVERYQIDEAWSLPKLTELGQPFFPPGNKPTFPSRVPQVKKYMSHRPKVGAFQLLSCHPHEAKSPGKTCRANTFIPRLLNHSLKHRIIRLKRDWVGTNGDLAVGYEV